MNVMHIYKHHTNTALPVKLAMKSTVMLLATYPIVQRFEEFSKMLPRFHFTSSHNQPKFAMGPNEELFYNFWV